MARAPCCLWFPGSLRDRSTQLGNPLFATTVGGAGDRRDGGAGGGTRERLLSPGVTQKVTAWARGDPPGGLTEREFDVLRLVAEGLTNHQPADRPGPGHRRADGRLSRQQRPGEAGRGFAGGGGDVGQG
jgi:hypothetical protein